MSTEAPPLSDELKRQAGIEDAEYLEACGVARGVILKLAAIIAAKQRELARALQVKDGWAATASTNANMATSAEAERDLALAKLEAVTADNAALLDASQELIALLGKVQMAPSYVSGSLMDRLVKSYEAAIANNNPGAALLTKIAELEARQRTAEQAPPGYKPSNPLGPMPGEPTISPNGFDMHAWSWCGICDSNPCKCPVKAAQTQAATPVDEEDGCPNDD